MFESMKIIKIPNPSPRKARSTRNVNVIKMLEELHLSSKSRENSFNKMKNILPRESKIPSLKVRQLPMKSIEFKLSNNKLDDCIKQHCSPSHLMNQKLGLNTSLKKKSPKEKSSFKFNRRAVRIEVDEPYSSFQPPTTFTHSFNSHKQLKKGLHFFRPTANEARQELMSTQKILNNSIQRLKISPFLSKHMINDKFLSN